MQDIHGGKLDLNLMLALDALLQELNVTRAAARVGLTQSAMSHKLRRLRELFGDELLVGGRRGMVATPRAVELMAPIRRGLLELHTAVYSTGPFDPATAERRFTIISSDYADFVILPRVLEHLDRVAPGISLRIQVPAAGGIAEALENGSADLLMGDSFDGAMLRQRAVFNETFTTILRAGHPALNDADAIDIDRYVALGHVVMSSDGRPTMVDRALAERDLRRKIVLRTPYFTPIPFIVARSDLVATLPRALAEEAATFADLCLVDPPLPLPQFRIMATWHERAHRDPAHRWLRELSRDLTRAALAERRGETLDGD
ncbi:MAG: LysR family transcriptional regulator [Deltaproteobacteria bacterium]|nr:LysR family transcriptional regulator [Deltaproteobacteria bacterium]